MSPERYKQLRLSGLWKGLLHLESREDTLATGSGGREEEVNSEKRFTEEREERIIRVESRRLYFSH